MALVHDSLSDLFEHGSLPFIGRAFEIQLIHDFWKSTFLAERLRALVITGEAGSGKSRLLEATLPAIVEQGGLVAHVKLYHDATAAIAPLVLEALRSSNLFHHVSRSGSGTPLSIAAQALRRIARLRPLLLVIEDIQLLEGEALQELNQLLEMLADEPISALFVSRPADQGARGIIERYLVEEIALSGLHPEEIAQLWRSVFGEAGESRLIDKVHSATLGNPLALRSALREVIRHGTFFTAGSLPGSFLPPNNGLLDHALHHRVGLLAEGMVAHLSDAETKVAMKLAALGEVFSREAARLVLPDAEMLLDTLQRRGIITMLATPALPVNRSASESPLLTFSHSLIHKYLADRAMVDIAELVRILAFNPPLYSLLPIQLLTTMDNRGVSIDTVLFKAMVECVKDTIHGANMDNDVRSAYSLLDGINGLYQRHREEFTPGEQLELELLLMDIHFNSAHRQPWSEETEQLARVYLERTSDLSQESCVAWRLQALRHWLIVRGKGDAVELDFVLGEEEKLLAHSPELMLEESYIIFLEHVAIFSTAFGNSSHSRAIMQRMKDVQEAPSVPDDMKQMVWRKLSPLLLREFATPEDVEDRLALSQQLAAEATTNDMLLLKELFRFLESIGEMERLISDIRYWRAQMLRHGQYLYAQHFRTTAWKAEMYLGGDFQTAEQMIEDNIAISPTPIPAYFKRGIGSTLATTGVLCGQREWVAGIVARFPEGKAALWPELRIILAIGDADDAELQAIAQRMIGTPLAELIAMLTGDAAAIDIGAIRRCIEMITAEPMLCLHDLARRSVLLSLVTSINARFPERDLLTELSSPLQRTLIDALEWSGQRKLPPLLAMLLDNYGEILPQRQRAQWRSVHDTIAEERSALFTSDRAKPPMTISMIGTITATRRNAQPHRLRGERMRILLALLVANAIIAKPLSHEEFAAIATGIDDDPEAARLSLTHMVYRLREIIGTQAVLTGGSGSSAGSTHAGTAPLLNLAIVDVDLIRAWRAIDDAGAALLDGYLVKAAHSLREAIDVVAGEIIFPTLYDSFFEALRTDFEGRLRHLMLAIASRLLEEGDGEGAVALMERGFALMPDDEEIAERLQEMLTQLGRRSDAERIRARAQRSMRVS